MKAVAPAAAAPDFHGLVEATTGIDRVLLDVPSQTTDPPNTLPEADETDFPLAWATYADAKPRRPSVVIVVVPVCQS